jgi:hypothetical protein
MLKNIGIAFLFVFSTFNAFARDYTIVEKDTYGKGVYYHGTVVGNHAYVASHLEWFEQFDLKDPTNLVKLPDTSVNCSFGANNALADGNVLALRCPFAIEFFDISDPSNISLIGVHDSTHYTVNGIVLEGNRLYMLGGNSEVLVFDATDLTNLVELGRANVGSVSSTEVKKQGNFLYSIDSARNFNIYDVSDSTKPFKSGTLSADGTLFYEVVVIGNYAYLGTSRGLQVVDISNKASPILVTNVEFDEQLSSLNWFHTLDFDGRIFIGVEQGRNIRIIDVSNPAEPTISASKLSFDFRMQDAEIDGDNLVLFHGIDGIRTIDISNSNSFVELDHFTQSIKPNNVSLDGNTALVAGEGQAYHLIDIDSDLKISERGKIAGYHNFHDGMIDGDTVYLNLNNIFSTIDISDIDNPIVTDTDTLDGNWGVTSDYEKSGNQLIVGMFDARLGIYTFDSIGLTEVVSLDLGIDPETSSYRSVIDSVKKDDYLYVGTRETDVTIIDISEPTNPSITHHDWLSDSGDDKHLEVFGSRLFIARNSGLLTIDITDPVSPKFIETNSSFGATEKIQGIDERYGVVSNSTSLYLVDFKDETEPKIIHQVLTNSQFADIAADQTKILTANHWDSKLQTFQINQAPISGDSTFVSDDGLAINESLNVNDRESDVLTFSITQNVSHGVLTLHNDGSFNYTPNTDFVGEDSFQYTAEDEHGGSSSATVSITVESGYDHVFNATVDTMFFGQVTETGLEGDEFKFKILVKPANGKIIFKSSGKFKYLANPGFVGEDTFEYAASNGIDFSDNKTVKINVGESD